ncbi:serine/threonine-protein kinase [Pendulispora albinea]|uniref:Serine/threonine protein kinase n=1 Tax=Pendulispora albinea TaxID=2741071 RepID=A0ABZ2M3F4_9BACT
MVPPQQKLPVRVGDIVDGKYRVERVLGMGGMGIIAAATHVQLEQSVALKFVLPHVNESESFRERFLREARATVRLKSEHVARVHDVGTTADGVPFLVMELLEGIDLSKLVHERGPLPVADAVEYVLQACDAIIEAHRLGIVHRDLKPANLFVTRRPNGMPLVKVLDFGISKFVGPSAIDTPSLTQSSTVLGSPLYMAPEQLRSARAVDTRTDIWSIGVICYELLTGHVPFTGDTMTELCLKVVGDPVVPPDHTRDDLPPGLVAVVMRCLEKDPNRRFPNVAALAAALEPFSASAVRGVTERTWRSLATTAAPSDLPPQRPREPQLSATENPTWGGTQPMEAQPGKSRAFAFGLIAGGALVAFGAAGLFMARSDVHEGGRGSAAGVARALAPEAAVAPFASSGASEPAHALAGSNGTESALAGMDVDAGAPGAGAGGGIGTIATASATAPGSAAPVRPKRAPRATAAAGAAGGAGAAAGTSGSAAPASSATHGESTQPEAPRTSPNGAPILH